MTIYEMTVAAVEVGGKLTTDAVGPDDGRTIFTPHGAIRRSVLQRDAAGRPHWLALPAVEPWTRSAYFHTLEQAAEYLRLAAEGATRTPEDAKRE